MEPPRPAFLSVGELFGGVERHLIGMCTWMQRQGLKPVLILFHDRELARQAREIGVEPIILAGGSFDLGAPRRLARILAEREINVVHAHGYRAMVNAALARRHHRFGVVRTLHGAAESAGLSAGALKSRLYMWLERQAARRTRAEVCYVTQDLQRANASAEGRLSCQTVHNGIDPLRAEDFPRPADLTSDGFHFGAVGRISRVKALHFALDAMQRLDPALQARLDIIGDGPLRSELQAEVETRGLGDRVTFLGFRENVYDYLAHLDALLMPSLHEGLPYTILEAMSLGTPIIASRVGGLAEILRDGETALLVEVGDVDGLAAAMARMAGDSELSGRLSEAARADQAERLSLDRMGQRYWQIYERARATTD